MVIRVCLEKAVRRRNVAFSVSVRQVSDATGIDYGPIIRAIEGLRQRGWLILRKRGADSNSSQFTIVLPEHARNISNMSERKEGISLDQRIVTIPALTHLALDVNDAFRGRGGLGLTCFRIWELHLPLTPRQIEWQLKLKPRLRQWALDKLKKARLTETRLDGHVHRTGRSLDSVAIDLQTAGKTEAAKQRRMLERKAYAAHRDALFANACQDARILKALREWNRSKSAAGTLVEKYLRHRGIKTAIPDDLRCYQSKSVTYMIAAVRSRDGGIIAVQRTKLLPDGPGRGGRYNTGSPLGGSVRLGDPLGGLVAIAEGIETAMSFTQMSGEGVPCWASLGATYLPAVKFPDAVHAVIIAADNDDACRKSATMAACAYKQQGLPVQISYPDAPFEDYNDLLRAGVMIPPLTAAA